MVDGTNRDTYAGDRSSRRRLALTALLAGAISSLTGGLADRSSVARKKKKKSRTLQVRYISATAEIDGTTAMGSAVCPAGWVAVGGGFVAGTVDVRKIVASAPGEGEGGSVYAVLLDLENVGPNEQVGVIAACVPGEVV